MAWFKKFISKAWLGFKRIFYSTKKQRLVFWLVLIFSSLIIYLGLAWLSVSRAEIALVEYKNSFAANIICHEKCYLYRQARRSLIVSALKDKPKKIAPLLQATWEEEATSLELKKALVKILASAYGADNPPDYLREYILEPSADLSLVREIIASFNNFLGRQQEFKNNLANRLMNSQSLDEKIELLKVLREIDNDLEIDNYFAVLTGPENDLFKCEIVKNISLIKNKRIYFTLDQLATLQAIILNTETSLRLRRDLVLLLGDYYLVFPAESAALWHEIYASEYLDNISRLFAADSLNHLTGDSLILPFVSSTEWNEYYNY